MTVTTMELQPAISGFSGVPGPFRPAIPPWLEPFPAPGSSWSRFVPMEDPDARGPFDARSPRAREFPAQPPEYKGGRAPARLYEAGAGAAGRLVVVSNRVAAPNADGETSGGLAVALRDALSRSRGLWFGWSGDVRDDAAECGAKGEPADWGRRVTLDLTPDEYAGYYLGYANRCLWPVLHDRTDLVEYRRARFETYFAVNRRFAEALSPLLRDGDTIWVHDYHFMPLGQALRGLGHDQPIGFYLHVPFPPPHLLAALPGAETLLKALAEYDLVGFQTEADAERFRDCLRAWGNAITRPDGTVSVFGRRLRVGAFPVGIDVPAFAAQAGTAKSARTDGWMEEALNGRRLVIGADRLDYTKGLPQRFEAYRCLLERCPELRDKVTLLQIATPTREELDVYADLQSATDRLAGAINGEFGAPGWTPLQYVRRSLPRGELAALFRASRVGLVTPLRDGMNLVAKEYVAAQDPDDPGVLVLSRFAGAAETMPEALLVNPHDPDATAEALQRALTMPRQERRERHAALLARISEYDVHAWRDGFLSALTRAHAGGTAFRGDAASLGEGAFAGRLGRGAPVT